MAESEEELKSLFIEVKEDTVTDPVGVERVIRSIVNNVMLINLTASVK